MGVPTLDGSVAFTVLPGTTGPVAFPVGVTESGEAVGSGSTIGVPTLDDCVDLAPLAAASEPVVSFCEAESCCVGDAGVFAGGEVAVARGADVCPDADVIFDGRSAFFDRGVAVVVGGAVVFGADAVAFA